MQYNLVEISKQGINYSYNSTASQSNINNCSIVQYSLDNNNYRSCRRMSLRELLPPKPGFEEVRAFYVNTTQIRGHSLDQTLCNASRP